MFINLGGRMITLQQLIYFREVAKRENISKTAEALFVSQTTLSILIKKLEDSLGMRLFSRDGKKIRLNEAGKVYLDYVEEALRTLQNGQDTLERLFGREENTVTFCMSNSVVWTDALRIFGSRYPSYKIRQQNYSLDQFLDIMNSSAVDFAIAGLGDYKLDHLDYTVLCDDPLYLCVSPQHPFAEQTTISLEQLSDLPLISLPQTAPFRAFCEDYFKRHHLISNTVLECDYTLRKDLILANYGSALTTKSAVAAGLLGGQNRYIRIDHEDAKRVLILVWDPRRYLSKAALDFKEFIIEYLQDFQSREI